MQFLVDQPVEFFHRINVSEVIQFGFCCLTSHLLEHVGCFNDQSSEVGFDGSDRHLDDRMRKYADE